MQTCQLPSTSRLKGPAHTCRRSRGKLTLKQETFSSQPVVTWWVVFCAFLKTSNGIKKEGNSLKVMHLTIDCSFRLFLSAWADLLIMFCKMCCILLLMGLYLKSKENERNASKSGTKATKKKILIFFLAFVLLITDQSQYQPSIRFWSLDE